MRIGCSLPWEYLCGLDGAPEAQSYRAAFDGIPSALHFLKELGVTSVELRQITADVPAGRVLEAAGSILEAGMEATVHAWLADLAGEETPESRYSWLEPLAGRLAAGRNGLLVVVHAFQAAVSASAVHREDLEDRTVEALKRIAWFLEQHRLPARFALELNRDKGQIDPSTSFRDVTRMWQRIGRPGVGICWDWGHGCANALGGRGAVDPGPDFLGGVVHIHAHGLGPAGGTHWPLTGVRVPVARYLRLLGAAGYGGIYNLELSPWKFAPPGAPGGGHAVRAAIADSVATLKLAG